ncbi:hypothetical protein E2320_018845 [Naja naja]|nr:hypothetical protein E2320_018845 [Naja naja]
MEEAICCHEHYPMKATIGECCLNSKQYILRYLFSNLKYKGEKENGKSLTKKMPPFHSVME